MLNGAVTKCWRSGLKWTPLLPGGNCLLSLSHLQCPALSLTVVLIKVHCVCEQMIAVYDVIFIAIATFKLDHLTITDKGKAYTFIKCSNFNYLSLLL